jgi:copper chaperone CopZ
MNDHCHVEPIQKAVTKEERETVARALLAVWGMGCPNCAMRVRNRLMMLEGVTDTYVDHTVGIARVMFNPSMVTIPALIDAVASAGNDGRHEYLAILVTL